MRRCLTQRRGDRVDSKLDPGIADAPVPDAPPPWWPAAAPWPPYPWRGRPPGPLRRRRFLVRAIIFFAWTTAALVYGVVALLRWTLGPEIVGTGAMLSAAPLLVLACAFGIALIAVLARGVGAPLGELVSASERVASGDLAVRVREYGPPWLRSLARAFNSMTTRLELQHRQRRDLMADVAHELRTPLSSMQGRLEGMVDGVYPTDRSQVMQVLDDTRLLARLVEDLRTLANSEAGTLALQKETTDLADLVDDAVASIRPSADGRGVRVIANVASGLPRVVIDPVRVREVISNLLSNAIRYSPANDVVTIEVRAQAGSVIVSIEDHGGGIADSELVRIFDRFYKGASSNGSGLGLTIARNLVIAHGGTIRALRGVDGGTVVTFMLPIGETPLPGVP